MAEAAAERQDPALTEEGREKVKAVAAATDNVGLFFGEDIFIAIGSILLMVGVLEQNGIHLAPLQLSVWAIPSAIAAFLIHGARLLLLDRRLSSPRGTSGEGDHPKGGGGVSVAASPVTPPPRFAGSPSPSGDGEDL